MNQFALSCVATCLIGFGLAGTCTGQEQSFSQAEINAWTKHRAERYAFLEDSQRKASQAVDIVMSAWPTTPPMSLAKRPIAITAGFSDTGKWCQSPWSMASIDTSASPPLLVVCPVSLETYRELMVALNVLLARSLPGGLERPFTIQEADAATRAGEAEMNAILSYYASRLAGLYTSNSLTIRAPVHCPAEHVAFQASRHRPLEDCANVSAATVSKWLTAIKISRNTLDNLSSWMSEALYLAIIAHELGHVAAHGTEGVTAMEEEVLADRFALRVLRGDPEKFYVAGEILEYLNILWLGFSQLHIKTRYRLPSHEEARATAFARSWSCMKDDGVRDANIAKFLEEFRLFKLAGMPENFCMKKSN